MSEANQIDGTGAASDESLRRRFNALLAKVAQKRIPGAKGQQSQGNPLGNTAARENPIENFVSGAVAADSDEAPVTLFVSFPGEINSVTGPCRSDDVGAQTFFAQA